MRIKIPLNFKRVSNALLMLFLSCNLFSQVTVDVKNKPIKEVLKVIENKSSFKFFYNNDLKGLDAIVSLKTEDADTTLKKLFDKNDINFQNRKITSSY